MSRLIHVFGHGYGGTFVLNQVTELTRRGHEVMVVLPERGTLADALERAGIPVAVIPFGGSKLRHIPRILRAVWRLNRTLAAFRPDVLHLHLLKAMVVGRIAAVSALRPVVISQLGGPLPLEMAWSRWFDLVTAWRDDCILAPSQAVATIYARYPHTRWKTRVNYYGMVPEPFLEAADGAGVRSEMGVPARRLLVGMVAYMYGTNQRRFREVGVKGHEVFIGAAQHLADMGADIQMVIVGDEIVPGHAYRARLQAMARQLGVSGMVTFLGHRSDVRPALAAMDVVVVPSLSENCGGAVEPLLMGRPVVASAVGGLPEVVEDGVSGRLVPPRDARALAEAIAQLAALPAERRAAMGAAGRQHVLERFSLCRTVDSLEDAYEQTLARKRRSLAWRLLH